MHYPQNKRYLFLLEINTKLFLNLVCTIGDLFIRLLTVSCEVVMFIKPEKSLTIADRMKANIKPNIVRSM